MKMKEIRRTLNRLISNMLEEKLKHNYNSNISMYCIYNHEWNTAKYTL